MVVSVVKERKVERDGGGRRFDPTRSTISFLRIFLQSKRDSPSDWPEFRSKIPLRKGTASTVPLELQFALISARTIVAVVATDLMAGGEGLAV